MRSCSRAARLIVVAAGSLLASGGAFGQRAEAQAAAGQACPPGCITEYTLPPVTGNQSGAQEPFGISPGPDGALWFSHGDTIERMTLAGAVKEFPVPTPGSGTGWLTLGPDRAIWFAERNTNKIGRISTNGRVTEYPIPGAATCSGLSPVAPNNSSVPMGITTGPDGAMWFTEQCGNRIGRLSLDGQITEYPVPTPNSLPLDIIAGPDGALWFSEIRADKIGRITTSGQITEFPTSPRTSPRRITVGPDGALWFAEVLANKIGRMTMDGQYAEYPALDGPAGIATGPDGAIWFVAFRANMIGRMTTDGRLTNRYAIPTSNSNSLVLTIGPDAAVWVTESGANQLARLQIPGVHGRAQVMATDSLGTSASFTISFTSVTPGQGEIYFGSGLGCWGLVEVATEDVHPGTTQHSVVVTENDLPGTVGDNGIQPGAIYWYEAVTVTRNGTQIDNNGGKCYSVAVPSA